MKLTAILLFAASLQLSARTFSQTVTLDVKATQLDKVFSAIKKQTGYVFFYDVDLLKEAKPVTLSVHHETLLTVLNQLFATQPLGFSIKDKNINVFRKKAIVTTAEAPELVPPAVHGRIINENGEPIAGVAIAIKGGKTIGLTNENGEFTLTNIPDNATLVFSAVNVETYEVLLTGRTELAFTMKTKVSILDEVQIGAYSRTSKRLQTGNVATLKGEELQKQVITNPLSGIEGRLPGVHIVQSNGLPGSGISVQVDGRNSIQAGNDPLYVVDGVPYISQLLRNYGNQLGTSGNTGQYQNGNPLSYINPADIESISVLKDADATAIYGSRAANGAVIITTKKGVAGAAKLDVNIRHGIGRVGHKLDLLNTQQYLQMRREALKNDGLAQAATDYDINGTWDTTRYTDWQKELIGGTSQQTDLNATLSGGTNNIQYLIGTTYHRETTVMPGNFSDNKGAVHFNINSSSANQRFHVELSGNYLVDNNLLPTGDLTTVARTLAPDAPALYNSDGSLNWAPNANGTSTWANPLAALNSTYQNKTTNLIANAIISYKLIPGLDIRSSFGYTNLWSNETQQIPLTASAPENRPIAVRRAFYNTTNISSWIIEPQVTYRKVFGKLKGEVLLGATIQQNNSNGQAFLGQGYLNDNVMKDIKSAGTVTADYSTASIYKYNAAFTRLNLNWADKYLLNLTGRRDYSSRFGTETRAHNFGSVGAAWLFSEEGFIKNQLRFLSHGKLRASYGTTGSDQIADYAYLNQWFPTAAGVPYQGMVGYFTNVLPNPYLQWEETRKFSAGFELGLLKDRIVIDLGYFHNRSSNQLLPYTLPFATGVSNIIENFPATVQNSGWELAVNTTNIKSKDLIWTTYANLTLPKNKLIDFPNLSSSSYASSLVVGESISIRKLFHLVGVDPTSGQYLFSTAAGGTSSLPSALTDNTVIADVAPKFYGGLGNTIKYKSFQLDVFFQFVKQNGLNYYYGSARPGRVNVNQPVSILDRWRQAGDNVGIQKVSSNTSISAQWTNASSLSDGGFADASYIRLKNVSLSWSLPATWTRKIHMQSVRVFLQGQNLLTITQYIGIDPETLNVNSLPPLRMITAGVNLSL